MLTPQEVSDHTFAKAGFGGYNMAMVDEFLDTVTTDYTALYKENAALKAKMKVLVEKVEEYRSTEDAMRKALLTAQAMADDMVKEAEKTKAELITTAEIEAKERVALLRQQVNEEETKLISARNAATLYLSKLREMYQREMEYLDSLESMTGVRVPEPQPQPTPREDPVAVAVAEIEANMNRMLEEEVQAAPVEEPAGDKSPEGVFENPFAKFMEPPVEEADDEDEDDEDTLSFPPAKEEPQEPTRRIDLNDLQFGKDFDLE